MIQRARNSFYGRMEAFALLLPLGLAPLACADRHGSGTQEPQEDTTPPGVSLAGDRDTFTAPGVLTLTAQAHDALGVSRVVFRRDGVVIGEDTAAPWSVTDVVSDELNGTRTYTAEAFDAAGNRGTSTPVLVMVAISGVAGTRGTLQFHLHLGVGTAQDQMILDGDNYTDLILSNLIAGVMLGHMVTAYYPGLQFHEDYLYGSIFAQLLQENIATQWYQFDSDLIAPRPEQAAVMGVGQGGPYQINNYAVDMVGGGREPVGHSLVNFIALQKNLGYTMATAATQFSRSTPASFNNKYYGPMVTAYFHYLDFVGLIEIGKGEGGWVTPWQPAFDNALVTFKSLPDNFFEVLLNVAYNQGFYGPLMASYSELGASATADTVEQVNHYQSVWGSTDTYVQYPYQVRYYLDQLYGNLIPTTSPTTLVRSPIQVHFTASFAAAVFSKVFQTLSHSNGTAPAELITAEQALGAFNAALADSGLDAGTALDLSAAGRAALFQVLRQAIVNLETDLKMAFNATTLVQL